MSALYECIKDGNPHPVVSALVVEHGKALMVLRGKGSYEGYWALPGGIVDKGEEPIDAVFRELKEETGVVGASAKILTAYRIDCRVGLPHTSIDIVYAVSTTSISDPLKPDVNPEEIVEVKLFDIQELPEKIAFGHREIIKKFAAI